MRIAASVLILLAVAAPAVAEPSFDCAKAGAPVEKALCSVKGLGHLDGGLNRQYRARIKSLGNGPEAEAFRNEQRAWIAGRDKRCPVSAAEARDPSDKTITCLYDSYLSRMKQINDGVLAQATTAPEAPWTGKRSIRVEGNEGDLTIVAAAGGMLTVKIDTLNLPRDRNCEAEFTLKPAASPELRWVDTEKNYDDKNCAITLKRIGAAIKVSSASCQLYCAGGVGFDGIYAP